MVINYRYEPNEDILRRIAYLIDARSGKRTSGKRLAMRTEVQGFLDRALESAELDLTDDTPADMDLLNA